MTKKEMLDHLEELQVFRHEPTDEDRIALAMAIEELQRHKESNKAIELMAEYIVTLGGVDYHLCDEIQREIHLKHQPKDDGNYDNEPCQRCVAEYFLLKAGEEE